MSVNLKDVKIQTPEPQPLTIDSPKFSPQYTHQDPEYVGLVKKGIEKLENWNQQTRGTPHSRAVDNLRSQQDFWFYEALKNNIDKSPQELNKLIESSETILRQAGQPIKGTEGHHSISLGSSRRLRNFPVEDQLKIGSITGSKGYRGGTNPHGLAYLSKPAHSKIAHLDPWKVLDGNSSVTNFKLWAEDNPTWREGNRLNMPFEKGMDFETAIDRYIDETLAPQKMLRDAALHSPADSEVRKQLIKFSGTDNFKQQDLKLRASTVKLFDMFDLNFTEMVNDVEKGVGLILPKMKGSVVALNPRRTESRRYRYPVEGFTKYGAGLGDFGSDFILRNAAGEIAGIGLDPKVHELILDGKYNEAAKEGIGGAIIGGLTQEIIRRVPALAARAPQLAIVAAPVVLYQIGDVYSKKFTGKSIFEHIKEANKMSKGGLGSAMRAVGSGGVPSLSDTVKIKPQKNKTKLSINKGN